MLRPTSWRFDMSFNGSSSVAAVGVAYLQWADAASRSCEFYIIVRTYF